MIWTDFSNIWPAASYQQSKIKSGRVDFGSIRVTEYTQLDNTAHLMMKGVADDNAHNGVPLVSPDPHQPEDLRWGMVTSYFLKNFCSSMGSCGDALTTWISSKCSKSEQESFKADRAGDRSSKFLDDVLDELRWGIETSTICPDWLSLEPTSRKLNFTFQVWEFNMDADQISTGSCLQCSSQLLGHCFRRKKI